MMSTDNPSADLIRDQAARWAARLNDTDISDAEREELHQWLLADPRHSKEFRAHNAVLALAHEFPADLRTRLNAFVPAGENEYVAPKRRWTLPSALAAGLLLALVIGGWFVFGRQELMPQSYATRTGEIRTVTFGDGSVAHLNTRTQLKWLGGSRDRRVTLLEGEALFDVVHDPDRPFRVVLENSEILVLGTRFNVYRKKNGETTITVLEGVVKVHENLQGGDQPAWQRRLSANQQIVYRPVGLLGDVRAVPGEKAIKWRQGVIEIQNEPLPEVLEELTRYTDQRIVIRDPALNELRVGGVLNVRDVRVALARLQKLAPVEITQSGDTFTLAYQTERH
jgi:transmembrane sensor